MEVSVFEVTLQSVNFKMTEHINSKDVGYFKSENMAPHMRAQTHTCYFVLKIHCTELTTLAKVHILYSSCWGQWLEKSQSTGISVVKGVSGVHDDVALRTE